PSIPLFFLLGRFLGDVSLLDAAIGAAAGFGVLKAVEIGYRRVTGRDGLGGGDAMLMAIVGGFLGWRALPFTMGLGALLGTVLSVPLLLVQRRRKRCDAATQQDDVAMQQSDLAARPPDAAKQQDDVATQQPDAAPQQDAPTAE